MSAKGSKKITACHIEDLARQADHLLERERRNIEKVYNPLMRRYTRACHHGYSPPHKKWTSRLEEQMEQYGKE